MRKSIWTPMGLLLPVMMHAQGVYNNGANLVLNGAVNLVINNAGLSNNGSISAAPGSTVSITGNAPTNNAFIGGTPFTLSNLTVSKTANDVIMTAGIAVLGNLTMNGGNLLLNNFDLNLDFTGTIIGENSSSRITGITGGAIFRNATLNAPNMVNPGNIGVEISSPFNLGTTAITRGHKQQATASGGYGIYRYYTISPANNTNVNGSLKMYYFDDELAGISKAQLGLFLSINGGGTWTSLGADNSDPVNDWVQKGSLDQFNYFTLGSTTTNVLLQPKSTQTGSGGSLSLLGQEGLLEVYPNPAYGNMITLSLPMEKEADFVLNLVDQRGSVLQQHRMHCFVGSNQIPIDIGRLTAGIYNLVWVIDGKISQVRFVKL